MRIVCEQCGYRFERLPPNSAEGPDEQACPECGATVDVTDQIRTMASQTTDAGDDSNASPPAASLSRRTLGDYDILEEISRGAMGVVYKARHRHLGRVVALKVMIAGQDASQDQIVRFEKEARAAARLRHPNIVSIYDVGCEDGKRFFTMDFIEGTPLDVLIARGKLTPPQALDIAAEVGHALAYAHQRGVIHRDIKPSNIMIDSSGRPQIMDFGLAKEIDGDTKFTRSGTTIGTPSYMSPEQARGENTRIDHRSDVYSLGAVLHEMLSGQPPFTGETMMNIVMKVIHDDPVPLRRINPKLHRDIETIVLKALEKEPSRRYASMQEFADDVRRYLAGEMIAARPAGPGRRVARFVRKHRAPIVVALIITLLASAVSGAIIHWMIQREQAARLERESIERALALSQADQTPEWVEKFRDDFAAPALAPIWKPSDKQWAVKDGKLVVTAGRRRSQIELGRSWSGTLRVEFTASVTSPKSRINSWIGKRPATAYSFRFGNWEGNHLTLLHMGRPLAQIKCQAPKPGVEYRFRIERHHTTLTCRVTGNGETYLLEYEDPVLLRQMESMQFGLDTWDATVAIGEVRISREEFTGPGESRLNVMQFIDFYIFSRGQIDKALEDYKDMIRNHSDTAIAALAEHYCGLIEEAKISNRQAELTAALNHYRRFNEKSHLLDSRHQHLIERNSERIFFVLSNLGEYTEAAEHLEASARLGHRLRAGTVWALPGILSRSAVARTFEPAIQMMESARFQGEQPTLRDQCRNAGGRILSAFTKALTEVCGGLAGQKRYAEMKRAFLALPLPGVRPTFESAVAEALASDDAPNALDLLAFVSQQGVASRRFEALATQLAQTFLTQKQYARVANVHTAYPSAQLAPHFNQAISALAASEQLGAALTLLEDACKRFATDKRPLTDAAGVLMKALLASGRYEELRDAYAMLGDPRFAATLTDAAARLLAEPDLQAAHRMLDYARDHVAAKLPEADRLAAALALKYLEAGQPEVLPRIARKHPNSPLAPMFVRAIGSALDGEKNDIALNLLAFALSRYTSDTGLQHLAAETTKHWVANDDVATATGIYANAAAASNGKTNEILRLGARHLMDSKAYAEAAELYTQAATANPDGPGDPDAMLRSGILQALLEDRDSAAKSWDWILEKHEATTSAVIAKLLTGKLSPDDFQAWQAKNPKQIDPAEAAFYTTFRSVLLFNAPPQELRNQLLALNAKHKEAWFREIVAAALETIPEPLPPPEM
jgi:tRNA A-37 threonylcarbamoyl transferase component Bud32